ncbi:MAG: hypothetical protein PVG66_14260 [Chromatiales bacterium]
MQKSSAFTRFLFRLTGNLRCRIINGNQGEPYLERYHLLRLPGGGGVYIHRFIDSDPDRGLHDHPWKAAVSLILAGSYRELRLIEQGGQQQVIERIMSAWRLNRLKGDDFHRIVLHDEATPVWTLFAHTGKYKDWGFLNVAENGEPSFVSHESVAREEDHRLWWKTAPKGKYISRAAI